MQTPVRLALLLFIVAPCAGCDSRTAEPPSDAVVPISDAASSELDERDLLSQIRALHNDSSPDGVTVFYPAEFEAKALRLRSMIREARQFYSDSLDITEEIWLAVLTEEQWNRTITWQPYGIPGVAGKPAVAFLPATDDNTATNDALDLRPHVSAATIGKLEAAGYSWEEASRRYVNLVGLHELGHTYAHAYGIRTPSNWVNELLATYFAYAFLSARYADRATVWDAILDGYVDAVSPEHTTLAAFDSLYFGVGARNYIWYQARFQEMVERTHAAAGLDFLRRVRAAFPPDQATTPSPQVVLGRLERIQPGFAEWAASLE